MSHKSLLIMTVLLAVLCAAVAGCTGTKKDGYGSALSGRDVFDPGQFGMATYVVTLSGADHGTFAVIAHPGEPDGDRLTSVSHDGNASKRADVAFSRDGRKTASVLISSVNGSELQYGGGSPTFNVTTVDEAWNSLDDTYTKAGTANVTTPSGTYDGCTVYRSNKTVYMGGDVWAIGVSYYMYPQVPVPVMYTVDGPAGTYAYGLKSLYNASDTGSTPERAVQSFFDDLDSGQLDDAFNRLVTYDRSTGRYVPPDNSTYRQFLDNQSRTYGLGADGYRVQYVEVTAVTPFSDVNGDERALVQWDSVHYQLSTMSAYLMRGGFYAKEIEGQWRIIV